MKARLVEDLYQQLRLVEDQISVLATEKREQLKQVDNVKMRQVAQLLRLPGVGPVSSWAFVMEFFGWRQFRDPSGGGRPGGIHAHPLRQRRESCENKASARRATDAFGPWPSRSPGLGCGINPAAS